MTCLFSVEQIYMYITPSMANVLVSKSTKEAKFTKLKQKLEFATKENAYLFLCAMCWYDVCYRGKLKISDQPPFRAYFITTDNSFQLLK